MQPCRHTAHGPRDAGNLISTVRRDTSEAAEGAARQPLRHISDHTVTDSQTTEIFMSQMCFRGRPENSGRGRRSDTWSDTATTDGARRRSVVQTQTRSSHGPPLVDLIHVVQTKITPTSTTAAHLSATAGSNGAASLCTASAASRAPSRWSVPLGTSGW